VCTHLQKRGDTYYFRRRIPNELREFFGRREFYESLKTKDLQEAKGACRKRAIVTDALLERARRRQTESSPVCLVAPPSC